jgi:hypothetical protein
VYAALADGVLVAHFAFVLFVVFGGLLVFKWPRITWVHLPAVFWGVAIECSGGICPLTPLENGLRARAGERSYQGDFIAHHLLPVMYPEGLTREVQLLLGAGALVLNAAVYITVLRRRRKQT